MAAAVAVAVVAALFATGTIPWRRAASVSGVDFARARSAAESATGAELGGSWLASGGVGVDVRLPTSVPTTNLTSVVGTNCTASALPGGTLPSQLLVPPFAGSFGSGLAPFWLFVLAESSTKEVVVTEVLNGTATPLATVGGAECAVNGPVDHPLPAATVDSPAVAGLAWQAAGQEYVSGNPSLTTVALAAFAGGTYSGISIPGLWAVVYAPCDPLLGGTVAESADVAAMNLTSGALIGFGSGVTVDCPP